VEKESKWRKNTLIGTHKVRRKTSKMRYYELHSLEEGRQQIKTVLATRGKRKSFRKRGREERIHPYEQIRLVRSIVTKKPHEQRPRAKQKSSEASYGNREKRKGLVG